MPSQPLTGKFYDYVPVGTYNRQTTAANCNQWEYCRIVRNIARNVKNLATSDSNYTLDLADADFAAIGTFLNTICRWDSNTETYLGTRPWLGWKYNFKAIGGLTNYVCNSDPSVTGTLIDGTPILANQEKEKYYVNGTAVAGYDGVKIIPTPTLLTREPLVEPKWIACKLLEHVSRDMKKIPINDTEKTAVETLLAATTDAVVNAPNPAGDSQFVSGTPFAPEYNKNHYYGTKLYFGQVSGATVTTTGGTVNVSSNADSRLT